MAVTKIRLGTRDNGTPLYHYTQDDPTKAVVITGPIQGTVTLGDGTVVDVSDDLIEVEPEQAAAVADSPETTVEPVCRVIIV